MALNRREKEKKKLRYTNAKERAVKHDSAGWSSKAYKAPEGVPLFKFERAGKYRLDVIPFVAGKHNPYADEGIAHYERTYYVHRDVGPNKEVHACRRKNFGDACPICEWVSDEQKKGADWKKVLSPIADKQRQLFLVKDLDDKKHDGYKLFETSYHGGQGYSGFGQQLDDLVRDMDDDDPRINWWHPDDGMTLEVTTKEGNFNSNKYFYANRIDFVPRKSQYDESIAEEAPCLDECIQDTGYKKLKDLFEMAPDADKEEDENDNDEDEKPNKRPSSKNDDEDEDDLDVPDNDEDDDEDEDEPPAKKPKKLPTAAEFDIKVGTRVEYKGMKCVVTKISPDGTSLTLEDEDDDTHKGVGPEDVEVIGKSNSDNDDEDDDEPPVKKPGKKPAPKDDDDEDDEPEDEDASPIEDLDDEDDDDEPPTKKPGKKPTPKDDDDDDDDDDEPPTKKPVKKSGKK